MQRRTTSGAHRFRPNRAVLAVTAASALVAAGITVAVEAQSSQAGATSLTAALAAKLAQNVNQPVIVIMKNQPAQAPVGSGAADVRADAVQAAQQPLLSELAQVHATHVKRYTLVNAVAATVSAGEESRLKANADVAAVISDSVLNNSGVEPKPVKLKKSSKSAADSPTLNNIAGACSSKPQIVPEGLSLTNTASNNPSQPTARSLGITGAGVKVAYIADGLDPDNINFIRANGKSAFVDYQDFSGDGAGSPTTGGEAFLDANTIVGQGLHVYNLNGWTAEPYSTPCNIKIEGVAPGASMVGFDVFSSEAVSTLSGFLQAINYAVEEDHINVLNESFGDNEFPDITAEDAMSQFDNAAVAAGVVVVASTGDSGPFSTIGSPATDPNVIGVGASTQFQAYAQGNLNGTRYFATGWLNNNLSALSSGGYQENGGTVSMIAPGDSSWASCDASTNFDECVNDFGDPSNLESAGGTSESSPFVSGAAALVMQAYAKTHGGAFPAPALVKQILVSTATDVKLPADEQGSGLLNSYKAVELAESIHTSSPVGSTLLLSKSQLTATGAPGSSHSWPVTITNTGASSQTVNLSTRSLGSDQNAQSGSVTLNDNTSPQFTDEYGIPENYAVVHFNVAPGQSHLTGQLAWAGDTTFCLTEDCGGAGSFTEMDFMTLISPSGKLAGQSLGQGPGNYDQTEVSDPQPGTWTAVIQGFTAAEGGTTGTVKWRVATQQYHSYGSVSPSTLTLAPGQSQTVTVSATTPSRPGNASGSVVVTPSGGGGTSISVVTRSVVEPSSGSSGGGSFSGTLTGGNGREGAQGQQQYYNFNVPSGVNDITANVKLTNDAGDPVGVYLVNPDGDVLGFGQNTFNGTSTLGATAYASDPIPGKWTLIIDFAEPVKGDEISQPYSGNVAFNAVNVKASGLPDGKSTVLTPGKSVTVPVTITNTGAAPEDFFVDARTNTYQSISLATLTSTENYVPLVAGEPAWIVPTETRSFEVDQSAGVPSTFDVAPMGDNGDPDLAASTFGSGGVGNNSCGEAPSVTYAPAGGEITPGPWVAYPAQCGPYGSSEQFTVATDTMTVVAKGFDQAITSPTGDLWQPASLGSTAPFTPVVVNPGQSVTIPVTIDPQWVHNTTTFEGHLYIDTFDSAVAPNYQLGAGEAIALPYEYTVDGTTTR